MLSVRDSDWLASIAKFVWRCRCDPGFGKRPNDNILVLVGPGKELAQRCADLCVDWFFFQGSSSIPFLSCLRGAPPRPRFFAPHHGVLCLDFSPLRPGCHVVSVPRIRIRQKTLRWYLFGLLHRVFLPSGRLVDQICLNLYKQIARTADTESAHPVLVGLPPELQQTIQSMKFHAHT